MMNWNNTTANVSQEDIATQQQEQDTGKQIWLEFQQGKLTCQTLTNDQFDSLGEYFMGQSIGNTANHVVVDQRMKLMMGENGETAMHINWGENGTGCVKQNFIPMMGYFNNSTSPNISNFFALLNSVLLTLAIILVLVIGGIWIFKNRLLSKTK